LRFLVELAEGDSFAQASAFEAEREAAYPCEQI
jgi:hypothetical protein